MFDTSGINLLGSPVWDCYRRTNKSNTFTANDDGSYRLYYTRSGSSSAYDDYDTVGATFENLIKTNGASKVTVTYMFDSSAEADNGLDIQHWIRAVDSTEVNCGYDDLSYYDSVEIVTYSYQPIATLGTLHTVTLDVSECDSFYLQFLFRTYVNHKTATHIYNVTLTD